MILARWKTAAYKYSSAPRKLAEVMEGMEASTTLTTEEDFRPQKANTKRGCTSGQTWEVDVGKEWPRPNTWWVALESTKELENRLRKLDRGKSRKRRHWATQQKVEVDKLELGN